IRSMALIHQSLYLSNDFAQVNLSNVLEALIPALMQSYCVDHSQINYNFSTTEVLLSINQAIPCGLIINEIISNAFKHAFPDGRRGSITIDLSYQPDGRVRLSISDDGVGIGENIDLKQTSTLGLQLVHLLADQLGATLTINRVDPTRFEICFTQQK
ncbi:MAG TPA: ATP-binding protein, partial [Dongiaceae bacterium]|nr:ATP-binding protein [Dongiaceae bacterium]